MKLIGPRIIGVLVAAILLTACVQTPVVPMIPVAPGPNKSFDAFTADQGMCQQYAAAQTAPAAAAANNQAVGGALLSSALGAGLGAAIGAATGAAGTGAAIGAASGAAFGSMANAGGAPYAQMSIQQQYDIAYGQCMSARGNSVPGFSPPPRTPPYSPGGPPYSGPPTTSPYGPPTYPGAPVPPPPGY